MRLYELIERMSYRSLVLGTDTEIVGVSERAQTAISGTVFVCIRGAKSRGDAFAPDARARGVRAFVSEQNIPINAGETLILVENARKSLAQLSKILYGGGIENMCLIGVTGTKGKTTVTEMIRAILTHLGIRCLTSSTLGISPRHLSEGGGKNTTPDAPRLYRALSRAAREGITHAVIEVSSQALMQFRVWGLPFFAAVFTGLFPDHIGASEHADMEDYFSAKRMLFESPLPLAVTDLALPYAARITAGVPEVIDISDKTKNDLLYIDPTAPSHSPVLYFRGTRVTLAMGGAYNARNAALAMALCHRLTGAAAADMRAPLEGLHIEGRAEEYMLGGKRIIIDFAHNRESFRAVLSSFGDGREKRICVFGSVGERSAARRGELASAAEEFCRLSFITADDPRCEPVLDICREIASHFSADDAYRIYTDRREAVLAAIAAARVGDTVFLLGKGHERQQIIGTRAVPFSEREIILSLGAVPRYRSP